MRTKRAWDTANGGLDSPKLVWRPGSARTRWGSLQRSPRHPSWIQRVGTGWEGGAGRKGRVGRDRLAHFLVASAAYVGVLVEPVLTHVVLHAATAEIIQNSPC